MTKFQQLYCYIEHKCVDVYDISTGQLQAALKRRTHRQIIYAAKLIKLYNKPFLEL